MRSLRVVATLMLLSRVAGSNPAGRTISFQNLRVPPSNRRHPQHFPGSKRPVGSQLAD